MEWNQTVTLFHKEVDGVNRKENWSSQILTGVSATLVQRSHPYGSGMEPDNQLIVRIPSRVSLPLCAGDRMDLGKITVEGEIPGLPEFQKAYVVISVTDNRRGSGGLWHIKAVCQ